MLTKLNEFGVAFVIQPSYNIVFPTLSQDECGWDASRIRRTLKGRRKYGRWVWRVTAISTVTTKPYAKSRTFHYVSPLKIQVGWTTKEGKKVERDYKLDNIIVFK